MTVGGVADAAIGTLAQGVHADWQVLQIGIAPFEIGTVTAGMGVQKRGRTTKLRTGTVKTEPGFSPFLTANIKSPAGGLVTFGLPGQPRLFRINSSGKGLTVAFGAPGDSGSLVFGTRPGAITSTFPCVGLYFAGTYDAVSKLADPNTATVTGLAFDISNVMAQLNLETVCSCIFLGLLEAIFSGTSEQAASGQSARAQAERAERMMRRFRDGVLEQSTLGKAITEAITQMTPDVSRVLALDPTAFGLTVELLEPWANAPTSLAVLNRTLDQKTVATAEKLAQRLIRLAPQTEQRIRPLIQQLRENQGQPVRKLIGTYRPRIPKVDRRGED
jgi:hypothetical protein